MLGFAAIGELALGELPNEVGSQPDPGGTVDIALLSAERIVVFEASRSRIVIFESSGPRVRFEQMSAKLPYKRGDKWVTDRDPDEESYYAADITDELTSRNTSPVPGQPEILLNGVTKLSDPAIQTAVVAGVTRTFVVVFLGGVEGEPPSDWFWTARVRCANGERFDKTTHFNRLDT
jgi:hypothetical protein